MDNRNGESVDTSGAWHEMAESGSTGGDDGLCGEDRLFQALVRGARTEDAAREAGLSSRTAYRRMSEPDFRDQIKEARRTLRESIVAKLTDTGHDAISVLMELMHTSEDPGARLKAAKTILDSLAGFHRIQAAPSAAPESQASTTGRIVLTLPDDGRG